MIALEGLTVLDGAVEGEMAVDYVFLHGLNGSPKDTWTDETKDGTGFFWPRQVLADIPGCRVMTFGYNAAFERALVKNTTTINAIAQTFVNRLIDKRKGEHINRPLLLIAHSLGGLVIKRALYNIHADRHTGLKSRKIDEQNAIYDSIAGLVFMGTPHAGSHVTDAARVKMLKALARATFKKAPENLIRALSAHSNELQDLSASFERTTIFTQHMIEICTYFETKTTKFVVPRAMTSLHYLNEREEGIAKEHTKMAKFSDAQDDMYQSIRQRLADMGTDGLNAKTARQATYRVSQIPGDIARTQLAQFLHDQCQLGPTDNIRVHSLAARSGQRQSTKTATASFSTVPPLLLKKQSRWVIPFVWGNNHSHIVVDTDFHGFTALNGVEADKHVMDIIAIPGLGCHPFSVWQEDPSASTYMWLRDDPALLATGTQILLYGYDSGHQSSNGPASIDDIAISLISALRDIGRSSPSAKPVVFLAHSMGGVVLKQCLVELANTSQSELFILRSVKMCIFLAVPNQLPVPAMLAVMLGNNRFNKLRYALQAERNRGYLSTLDGIVRGFGQANGIRFCSGYETMRSTLPKRQIHAESDHTILLPKSQAIQDGSRAVDQFPVSKAHGSVLGMQAGSQTIDTIARLVTEASEASMATQDVDFDSASSEDIKNSALYRQFVKTLVLHGRDREDGIEAAVQGTFGWVWSNPEISLGSWLTDDKAPLFWIRGKPGSGKSTLIRYLWGHNQLSTLLADEVPGVSRIKAAFFFYYRGTHVQKSFEGMLHSVLLRVLEQEPRLSSVLLPEFARLKHEEREKWVWTSATLMKAYDDILTQTKLSVEIYLFLDALDEYDGPTEAIVNFVRTSVLKASSGRTRLKACFSSREWLAFEDPFSALPGFKIHEYTDSDILKYTLARLSRNPEISQRLAAGTHQEASDVRQMEEHIVNSANGVFVWVKAVSDEIVSGFSKTKSTSELLTLLKSLPTDLDSFYTDAIKRLPFELRMEAFSMFEVMARSDTILSATLVREAVSCAQLSDPQDCAMAIRRCRELPGSDSPTRWAQDRGAGLVEFKHPYTNAPAIITFMHQSVLDFVLRPGFRGLVLDHAFALPLENGYSILSKWMLSIGAQDQKVFEYHEVGEDLLAVAEATTGKSLRSFLDSLDNDTLTTELKMWGCPIADISNPKMYFAVVQGLNIFIQEVIQEHGGVIPDKGNFSLLHCLAKLSDPYGAYGMAFPISRSPARLEIIPILFRHGARVGAVWQGKTPFQMLVSNFPYTIFTGSGGHKGWDSIPIYNYENVLALHLLSAGQDPNVSISIKRNYIRRQDRSTEWVTCKPLHLVPLGLAEILIAFGAKVNVFDSKGRTPLDLACGVGGNPFEVGDHVPPLEAYSFAQFLLSHGAQLSLEGSRIWPDFVKSVSRSVQVPEEFLQPGVMSRASPGVVLMKIEDMKLRIKRDGIRR
ncbi:SERAC1 [Colletotrichum higginsianum]|nr:SERAC1 [Colletotrichum higginsianum]